MQNLLVVGENFPVPECRSGETIGYINVFQDGMEWISKAVKKK